MSGTSKLRATDVLARVTLVTGKEEFLNERTVVAVRDARMSDISMSVRAEST